jgi:hypothetical protein
MATRDAAEGEAKAKAKATRIAAEADPARIAMEAKADGITVEAKAARIAGEAKAEADRIAAEAKSKAYQSVVQSDECREKELEISKEPDIALQAVEAEAKANAKVARTFAVSAHHPIMQSPERTHMEEEQDQFWWRVIANHSITYLQGKTADKSPSPEKSPPPQHLPSLFTEQLGNVSRFYGALSI